MAQERLAYPRTMLQSMEPILKRQETYEGGMNSDDPQSEIGPSDASDLFNLIAFPKYCTDRPGSKAINESLLLPSIIWYSGADPGEEDLYQFHTKKVGYLVFIYDDGAPYQDPAQLIGGNYLVYGDGTSDEIHAIGFDSNEGAYYFTSSFSGDRADDYQTTQRNRVWAWGYNSQAGSLIVQLGSELWYTNPAGTTPWQAYKQIVPIGNTEILGRSVSIMRSDKEQVYVFNERGIFRIVFDTDSGYYYKINADQPTTRILEDTALDYKTYGRNRIYCLSRIVAATYADKPIYGNRNTEGLAIQQESASVLPDAAHKDASMGYQDIAVGIGSAMYQQLASTNAEINPGKYRALVLPGAFDISLNGIGPYTIVVPFDTVLTMNDVCLAIQNQLRQYWPTAECYFQSSTSPSIIITGGKADGSKVDYITDATASGSYDQLTNAGLNFLHMENGNGGVISTLHADAPQLVYGMNTNADRWTHISIYSSNDTGVNGIARGNIPDFLVWNQDVPIIKCFRATRDVYGNISITGGNEYFLKEDEGSFIAWMDNTNPSAVIRAIEYIKTLPATEKSSTATGSDSSMGAFATPTVACIGAKKMTRAYQKDGVVYLDGDAFETWNKFDNASIPSADTGKILFLEDGGIRHILEVKPSGYECVVHEADSSYDFGDDDDFSLCPAVAWDPILQSDSGDDNVKAIQIDTIHPTNTYNLHATKMSGSSLTAADEGKKAYFFYQGVLLTDANAVLQDVTGSALNFQEALGGILSLTTTFDDPHHNITVLLTSYMPPRFFNDVTPDTVLESRGDDPAYVLQERYFRPLPSGSIGDVGQGFLFVGENGTNKISYSSMPQYRKYIVGFYHPSWQADTNIEDVVTFIKKFPDRMVAFGNKSTWGTNLNQINIVKQTAIGEDIFTVPAFSLVDNIGFMHLGSIQDLGIGQAILVTADGRTMFFNGRQYGNQDFSGDKVSKAIRSLHTKLMSSYDPWGGYLLYGSANVSSDTINYVNANDGFCLRFACFTSQGCGWARYGGLDMVFPMPNTGGQEVYDASNMAIQVMLDERTGQIHQINTYDGPAGSGLTESHYDKGGADIVSHISLAEYHGTRESEDLEHMVSHVYIRPRTSNNQYLENFAVNSQIYKDGSILYSAKTLNNPIQGDIAYDRKIQGKRIQSVFEFMAGGFYITANDIMFVQRDTAGSTAISARTTSEMDFQREYAQGNVWLTRGSKPLLNRQSGFSASGSFTAIEGADGIAGSAMQFNGGDGVALDNGGTLANDMTVQFGFKFKP